MAFAKKTWKDRIAEFPTRRRLTKEDNTSELVTVAREEGTLSQEGDAFSAENMNDLESRIDAEFTELNGKLSQYVKSKSDAVILNSPDKGRKTVTLTPPSEIKNKVVGVLYRFETGSGSYTAISDAVLYNGYTLSFNNNQTYNIVIYLCWLYL